MPPIMSKKERNRLAQEKYRNDDSNREKDNEKKKFAARAKVALKQGRIQDYIQNRMYAYPDAVGIKNTNKIASEVYASRADTSSIKSSDYASDARKIAKQSQATSDRLQREADMSEANYYAQKASMSARQSRVLSSMASDSSTQADRASGVANDELEQAEDRKYDADEKYDSDKRDIIEGLLYREDIVERFERSDLKKMNLEQLNELAGLSMNGVVDKSSDDVMDNIRLRTPQQMIEDVKKPDMERFNREMKLSDINDPSTVPISGADTTPENMNPPTELKNESPGDKFTPVKDGVTGRSKERKSRMNEDREEKTTNMKMVVPDDADDNGMISAAGNRSYLPEAYNKPFRPDDENKHEEYEYVNRWIEVADEGMNPREIIENAIREDELVNGGMGDNLFNAQDDNDPDEQAPNIIDDVVELRNNPLRNPMAPAQRAGYGRQQAQTEGGGGGGGEGGEDDRRFLVDPRDEQSMVQRGIGASNTLGKIADELFYINNRVNRYTGTDLIGKIAKYIKDDDEHVSFYNKRTGAKEDYIRDLGERMKFTNKSILNKRPDVDSGMIDGKTMRGDFSNLRERKNTWKRPTRTRRTNFVNLLRDSKATIVRGDNLLEP